jgi:hypothetical protein
MQMPIAIIPQEIIDECNPMPLACKDHAHIETQPNMCGLAQAGLLANNSLTKQLAPKGCHPCRHTPGPWHHKWKPILFSLVVDNFGAKHMGKQNMPIISAPAQKNNAVFPKIGKERHIAA